MPARDVDPASRARVRRNQALRVLLIAALIVGYLAMARLARAGGWPSFTPAARPAAAPATPPQRPHPAVVRVIAPEEGGTSYGSGTLVDVRGDYGLVLTNWHVVSDATHTIEVVFPDGFRSAARVITTDRTWDLAALAIWKPNVEPVPLAPRAPQPGEPLTIAGYGSGTYRAITGTCTQYVAPALNKPYEMVELSVAARQGDSGGPILNSRGELAGVLWGAGWGTTSGSYSGRVAAFVAAIMPPPGSPGESQIADSRAASRQVVEAPTAQQGVVPAQFNTPLAVAPAQGASVGSRQTAVAYAANESSPGYSSRGTSAGSSSGVNESTRTSGMAEPAPASAFEQMQMFFALVGAVALLMHGLRLVMPSR